ncbi:MAG TPA: DUF4389 domain-containing protein [Arthrobacter sp.]|nr:DUF4389 domain-containing protein [Arthrobacter sp.]
MRARSIIMLILGIVFSMLGVGLLVGGIGASWATSLQNDGGYLTSPSERFDVDSSAIIFAGSDTMRDRTAPGPLPFDVGSIRILAKPADPGKEIFVGIAPRADVDRYLSGTGYSELLHVTFRPFHVEYRESSGAGKPQPPSAQQFWAASVSGAGEQKLDWKIQSGNWTVVVMNADASPGIRADLKAGFRSELFGPIAAGLLAAGSILLVIGVPLLAFGAHGLGRAGQGAGAPVVPVPAGSSLPQQPPPAAAGPAPFPARIRGELDPGLSRWLWLVKWFLAIPHFVVLFFLWFAFVVVTVVAGFAILFTGRYPRSLFTFNVGVLRWNWRVAFYAYAALGTDKYPPFTLARTDYPADFDVEYPERLSRGLVLVKWWLLALPQLIVIGALTGTDTVRWNDSVVPGLRYETGTGFSLFGFLVLVAGVLLLFTGRYQRPLFDLLLGFNRWIYRVITYVALMRDEYPPFRLDQGPTDSEDLRRGPGDADVGPPPAPPFRPQPPGGWSEGPLDGPPGPP